MAEVDDLSRLKANLVEQAAAAETRNAELCAFDGSEFLGGHDKDFSFRCY